MNFVVMRPAETQEDGGSSREGQHSRAARRVPEPQYFRRHSTYMKVIQNIFLPNQSKLKRLLLASFLNKMSYVYLFGPLPAVGCWNFNFLLTPLSKILVAVFHKFYVCLLYIVYIVIITPPVKLIAPYTVSRKYSNPRVGNEKLWEQTPASVSGDESPALGPPSVLIKRPGVLLTLLLQGHCYVGFWLFLWVAEDQSW